MGIIYKITNQINKKIYIGQTRVTEPVRWQQHVWYANNCPEKECILLCYAIRKYGKDNFFREVIETCDNKSLNEREKYWIKYYNSNNRENGYNITIGGDGHCKFSDEDIKKIFEEEGSIVRASQRLGMDRGALSKRLQGMGFVTTRENPIEQYSLTGELLNIYSTAADASRETGVSASSITSTKTIAPGGYLWRRTNSPETIEVLIKKLSPNIPALQGVEQYNSFGDLIAVFDNAAKAARSTGINLSSIKAACSGKQNSAGGFLWRRVYNGENIEEKLRKFLLSSSCCEIEEIDKDGNVIKTFASAGKAEKELGWSYNSIKNVCDGNAKHTHHRYFRYSNPLKRELINEKNG